MMSSCSGKAAEQTTSQPKTENTEKELADTDKTEKDKENSSTENESSDAEQGFTLDKSLSGQELLSSIVWNMPSSWYYAAEMTDHNGQTYKMEFWTDGESIKMVSDQINSDLKGVMIYNAKDKVTYQYNEGEKTGLKLPDYSDDEDDEDLISGAGELSEMLDLVEDSDDFVAEIRQLEGTECLYIETMSSEEGQNFKNIVWYSLKTGFMIQNEQYVDNTMISRLRITDYDGNKKFDSSIFNPPEDIIFNDFSTGFDSNEMEDYFSDSDDFDLGDLEDYLSDLGLDDLG